jgi:hypothetical protein
MSSLSITDNNICELNCINLQADTLVCKIIFSSRNIGKIIESLFNYKIFIPKLENIDITLFGTNTWIIDMLRFECLYFLMEDEQIKKMSISNSSYSIEKINNNFILKIPYSSTVQIPHNVHEINFIYDGGVMMKKLNQFFIFKTIFQNFPPTLNKINLHATISSCTINKICDIKIFDSEQKIPFGTEVNLIMSGRGEIVNLTCALSNQKVKIFHSLTIKINNGLKDNKEFEFIIKNLNL